MTDESDDIELVSTTRVSRIFGVTTETIRDWIAAKKFPNATQTSGRWYVPMADVRALARKVAG